MKHLTDDQSWSDLAHHAHLITPTFLEDLKQNEERNAHLSFASDVLQLDCRNQRVDETARELLLNLAHTCQLQDKIQALVQGEPVNISETRPALHTALRAFNRPNLMVNEKDISIDIWTTHEKMDNIASQLRNQTWYGYSGKPICDIVNIGIGGSDLGPRFCIHALKEISCSHLNYHFISDADPNAFSQTVKTLNPETTLFIISSKSFTTKETLYNAKKAVQWLNAPIEQHFIAVTANTAQAKTYGFKHILPIWDWIGGRYSLCSAINLITVIAIGFEGFKELLAGAHWMDKHYAETPLHQNMPVMLALFGIWNNNFLNMNTLLLLVYTQRLEYLVPYIQQLDMESNGKSLDNEGIRVNYATGPIVWGGLGNQAQHSYYQLLCQGTHSVTLDFITVSSFDDELINQLSSAKQKILTQGVRENILPHQYISGNHPLNHLQLKDTSPYTLGQLISLYEHKIYTQGVIWNINPFDQPGVESAKRFLD